MDRDYIIEKIKLNKRFVGNEDLLDLFIDLIEERLSVIVSSIESEDAIDSFTNRTVSKAILDVLRDSNRLEEKHINKIQKVDYSMFKFDNTNYHSPKVAISQLKQLYSLLKKSDENNETAFLDIVNYRYKDKLNLQGISEKTGMTQEEILEILYDMSEYSNKVARI